MFQQVASLIAGAVEIAPPKDWTPFQLVDAEAGVAGAVYKWAAAGRITVCTGAADEIPAVIVMEDADAATPGAKVRGFYIVPGAVFKVRPATADGTTGVGDSGDKHASFIVGGHLAPITANGKYVDWATDPATPTTGPLAVLKIIEDDSGDSWLYVAFRRCFLNNG